MSQVKLASWMYLVKTIEVKHEVIEDYKRASLFDLSFNLTWSEYFCFGRSLDVPHGVFVAYAIYCLKDEY